MRPDYKQPIPPDGFNQPPREADRFQGNHEIFGAQDRKMSGDLPDQPADLPVNATGETAVPWKDLKG